jgi:hypothetical protein
MKKEAKVENRVYSVHERVDKFCVECNEERGHVVASVTKKGRISRVSCPKCGTRSSFKSVESPGTGTAAQTSGAPYDPTRTYRTGQAIIHPNYGRGEVTALIEPQKIDVLFPDRMRRLIHARAQHA